MEKISFSVFKKYCKNRFTLHRIDEQVSCKILPLSKCKCTEKNCPVFKKLKNAEGK